MPSLLFFTPYTEEHKLVVQNLQEMLVEENLGNEIKIIDVTTKKGLKLVKRYDVPEVPCFVVGNRFYFRDDIIDKERLRKIVKKHG